MLWNCAVLSVFLRRVFFGACGVKVTPFDPPGDQSPSSALCRLALWETKQRDLKAAGGGRPGQNLLGFSGGQQVLSCRADVLLACGFLVSQRQLHVSCDDLKVTRPTTANVKTQTSNN